jgi:hypothetical protein
MLILGISSLTLFLLFLQAQVGASFVLKLNTVIFVVLIVSITVGFLSFASSNKGGRYTASGGMDWGDCSGMGRVSGMVRPSDGLSTPTLSLSLSLSLSEIYALH